MRFYDCPESVNPRYWLFALETGATRWESNVDFMLWLRGKLADFRAGFPEAFRCGNLRDHGKFDRFLATFFPPPTPGQIERAWDYFAERGAAQEEGREGEKG